MTGLITVHKTPIFEYPAYIRSSGIIKSLVYSLFAGLFGRLIRPGIRGYCFDLFAIQLFSFFNIMQRLQVHPELGAGIQKATDLDSGCGKVSSHSIVM